MNLPGSRICTILFDGSSIYPFFKEHTMKLLIVGGAGYVGSILRPALEASHTCRYLDLRPIAGAEDRCFVGSVRNPELVKRAVNDIDILVWSAMGKNPAVARGGEHDLDAAFDVNVRDLYRTLNIAHRAGVRRFVYAGSLSVYERIGTQPRAPLEESMPGDAWHAYGMTKRLGEFMGQALARHDPKVTFISLRLMWPRNDADWPGNEYRPGLKWYPLGPGDLRRLFLAAVVFDRPGAYFVQATGDLGGEVYPNNRATELLGWKPEGK